MSELASARPSRLASPRPAAPPPSLRVVRRQGAPARPTLALISVAALMAAMVTVLLLNTAMAKGSFVLEDLQAESSQLAETEEALGYAVDAQSAPAVVAQRAIDMGMVPATSAAFLRLTDGAVVGVASPAQPQENFRVVAQGTGGNRGVAAGAPSTTTIEVAGTVTTTTVTTAKGDVIETTKTSVDSATGRTTTTTSTAPAPASPADPGAAPAGPDPQPAPSAGPGASPAGPNGGPAAEGAQ